MFKKVMTRTLKKGQMRHSVATTLSILKRKAEVFATSTTSHDGPARYTRVRSLGKGSFGDVWCCLDTERGFREVAMKTQSRDMAAAREIAVLRRVRGDANVVQCFDIAYSENHVHIVLEKGDCSLSDALYDGKVLDVREVVTGIARGLSALHGAGFIHTDLKPENVILVGRVPKLIDFGCAREDLDMAIRYTGENFPYFTTRWYRAPEIILGHVGLSTYAMDIWSLGCIAFQIATRTVLFPGTSEEDMLCWFEFVLGMMPEWCAFAAKQNARAFVDSDEPIPELATPYALGTLGERTLTLMRFQMEDDERYTTALRARRDARLLFSQIPKASRVCLEDLLVHAGCDKVLADLVMRMIQYVPTERPGADAIARALGV